MGDVLMIPQDMVAVQVPETASDVAESQAPNLAQTPCQTWRQSATVAAGRSQAAFASDERCAIGYPDATFQEYRRRGCRRARKLSWRCVLWPLLLPARPSNLKSFMWTSQFRLSLSTPANTNKSVGRAAKGFLARPAPSLHPLPAPRLGAITAPRSRGTTLQRAVFSGLFPEQFHATPRLFAAAPLGVLPACAYGCAHPFTGGTSC